MKRLFTYLPAIIIALSLSINSNAFVFLSDAEVEFDNEFGHVMENDGSISITIVKDGLSEESSFIDVELIGAFANAIEGEDFLFESTTLEFPAFSNEISFEVPVIDNMDEDGDRLFILNLSNPVNCSLGGDTEFVVYILDDEESAPVGTAELEIEFANSYLVDAEGSAEIVAFNKPQKRLYVLNSEMTSIEILDFNDPRNIESIASIDMTAYGDGATSVTCDNAFVAATVEGFDGGRGSVVFMNKNGVVLSTVEVGFLPDMITFTPDNHYALVANEGEPEDDYISDPEGSISVIDIRNGVGNLNQSDVTELSFTHFNDQIEELRAAGVRIFGLNSTVAQDVEPEYITVSEDSETAWVSLQENNAIAEIDLVNMEITSILPLGTKDHSLAHNSIDVSDRNDSIFMSTWNIKGMYMPDAIASYSVDGVNYVVTANEGDQREYGVINEDTSVKDDEILLDPTAYPDAELLKENHLLGRIAATPYDGDTDGDGDIDEIHVFGARSFSIWNTETGELVYDSGDDFEKVTAADPIYGSIFNASNSNNNFKNRSDNKGPEPEGITVAEINDEIYAFITLERVGGFMTYNISDPENAVFVDYKNNRTLGDDEDGDLGPEGIIYIDAKSSPVDTGMIVMANEVSATISVYYINNDVKKKGNKKSMESVTANDIKMYPNPARTGNVYFSRPVNFKLYNLSGQHLLSGYQKASMDISNLSKGMYFILTDEGQKLKLIVE